MITITGALNQDKLADTLSKVAGKHWCGKEVQLRGTPRTWDMAFYTDEGITLVEYDGGHHYCNPMRSRIDRAKDRLAERHNYQIIHFPYWLQLDTFTLSHFFHLDAEIKKGIPHGFITTRVFPADFCESGLKRFLRELHELPRPVGDAVARSLRDRTEEYGVDRVLPEELRYFADPP